jgi:hypothetical protein
MLCGVLSVIGLRNEIGEENQSGRNTDRSLYSICANAQRHPEYYMVFVAVNSLEQKYLQLVERKARSKHTHKAKTQVEEKTHPSLPD